MTPTANIIRNFLGEPQRDFLIRLQNIIPIHQTNLAYYDDKWGVDTWLMNSTASQSPCVPISCESQPLTIMAMWFSRWTEIKNLTISLLHWYERNGATAKKATENEYSISPIPLSKSSGRVWRILSGECPKNPNPPSCQLRLHTGQTGSGNDW